MAARPKSKEPEAATSEPIILVANTNLYDAYTQTRFGVGVHVTVPEITNWMQCQIDAGLLEVVNG